MRKIALALLAAVLIAPTAFAESDIPRSGSKYDWRTGNQYYWEKDRDGTTKVRGHNWTTGTQWNTTVEPDGSMRGEDNRGNTWRYDSATGDYWNSDGTMCWGRGSERTCNK